MFKISIYGIGNFGFALLKHLSKKADGNEFTVHAYDINKALRDYLRIKRRHLLHHKDIRITKNVIIERNSKDLVQEADVLILAINSDAIKEVVNSIKSYINKKIIILNVAKALDTKKGERFSIVISKCLKGIKYPFSIAMLAGGTIAKDLFNNEPLGVDIASMDKKTLKTLKDIFISDNLNVYTTTDLKGVEYAAAFKNVISIMAGVMKGLGFSYGSETHIISRMAGEVKRLVVDNLGGKEKTFSIESQCWGNDMWMSSTGNTRNREFGILLGRGYRANKALAKMKRENKTVEGIHTAKVIKKIIKNNEKKYPLLYNLYDIVFGLKNPRETILNLMRSNKI